MGGRVDMCYRWLGERLNGEANSDDIKKAFDLLYYVYSLVWRKIALQCVGGLKED
jgi:hypothetical protein